VTLYLKADVLSIDSEYAFYMHCGPLVASISVFTNSPPSYGVFEVIPNAGIEASTDFLFTATNWQDVDLPLMYSFRVFSEVDNMMLYLQDVSLVDTVLSKLFAGSIKLFNSL